MPFLYAEAYMASFFGTTPCPDDVPIPVGDPTAWTLYPDHHHVYNKPFLCRTQGIAHAPLPVPPPRFPVFVKPITNLLGMGIGSFRADTAADLAEYRAGSFWMELLTGRHVSTDAAILDGRTRWFAHTEGHPIDNGRFSHWERLDGGMGALERVLADWSGEHLRGFTGIVNFETIGARIIECHLRMSVEFIPLYGAGWLDAVVRLYRDKVWDFAEGPFPRFTVPSFTTYVPQVVDPAALAALEALPGVFRIFPTINDGMPELGNPPNGYRRAVIVAHALDAGRAAAARLDEAIRPRTSEDAAAGPPIVFRPARAGDGQTLFDITLASVRGLAAGHYTPDQLRHWMGRRDAAFYEGLIAQGRVTIAERAGVAVGFVDAIPGEVTRLFLLPDAAGKGLGAALLAKGIASARAGHDGPIRLEATINAENFYRRHGFRAIGRGYFSHGLGGDPIEIVHMELVEPR